MDAGTPGFSCHRGKLTITRFRHIQEEVLVRRAVSTLVTLVPGHSPFPYNYCMTFELGYLIGEAYTKIIYTELKCIIVSRSSLIIKLF